jgi:hypothetical protein
VEQARDEGPDPTNPTDPDDPLSAQRFLEDQGYRGQFLTRSDGQVECRSCGQTYGATHVVVDRTLRSEGASEAEAQAMLTLGFGPNADADDEAVLHGLDLRSADNAPPS